MWLACSINTLKKKFHSLYNQSHMHVEELDCSRNVVKDQECFDHVQKCFGRVTTALMGLKRLLSCHYNLTQDMWLTGCPSEIEFKILLLTFKCMQGCAPLYLRELLVKQANTRTLRSNTCTKNLLQIPLTNLKRFGDRAFCAYAPRL